MFWRGFGVLFVVGVRFIGLGQGLENGFVREGRNGTKISSVDLDGVGKGSMRVGDGQGLRFGGKEEVEEMVSTSRVDAEGVVKTDKGKEWSMSTTCGQGKGTEISRTTEVWIETKVNIISTCVLISTSSYGRSTSQEVSISSALFRSSKSGSKICGWREETSTVMVGETMAAIRTASTGSDANKSSNVGSTRTMADSGSISPQATSTVQAENSLRVNLKGSSTRSSKYAESSSIVATISSRQSITPHSRDQVSTDSCVKSLKKDDLSVFDKVKQGSTGTPLKTPVTTTRSMASTLAAISSFSGNAAQPGDNSALLLDHEEQEPRENNEEGEAGPQATPINRSNGTVALVVDDGTSLQSNGMTKMEAGEKWLIEALQTLASDTESSTFTVFDTAVMTSYYSTSTKSSTSKDESRTPNNGKANEPEDLRASNTTALDSLATAATKSAIFKAPSTPSSNKISTNPSVQDSEISLLNSTEPIVFLGAIGNQTFFDAMETSESQNVTADPSSIILHATVPEMMALSADTMANLTSSPVISVPDETIIRNGEMLNMTSTDSVLSATNMTLNLGSAFKALSSLSASVPSRADIDNTQLGELGNSSIFTSANHSADILSILAGNTTPPLLNETSALVIFALNQSATEDGSGRNISATEHVSDMGHSNTTRLSDAATSILDQANITIVGDPSIPLTDTKLREHDTLYHFHGTATEMGKNEGGLINENTSDIATISSLSIPSNDSMVTQSYNVPVLNSTVLVDSMTKNGTVAIAEENRSAPFAEINLNMPVGLYGVNESEMKTLTTSILTSPLSYTAGLSPVLNLTLEGVTSVEKGTDLHSQDLKDGTESWENSTAYIISLFNETATELGTSIDNPTTEENLPGTNATTLMGNVTFVVLPIDINTSVDEALGDLKENATIDPLNATLPLATVMGVIGNATITLNDTAFIKGGTVFVNAMNATDMADFRVVRFLLRPGNSLHMPEDDSKDVVCADESILNNIETLSRDEFGLVEQACLNLREKPHGLGMTLTTGFMAVEVIANATKSMLLDTLPTNSTHSEKSENYPSLTNFTESDGNAPERLGPTRTTATTLPTMSIPITPNASIQSATNTAAETASFDMSTLSTSFTSALTSGNSKTTSTSSSMRPKMTACVDDFEFFDMTDANLDESGTIAWYMNWTANSAAEDGKFNSLGEVRYFGQKWLKDPDYDCGLEHGGCTRRPSCNNILSLYPDDAELARRIYFVMKMHSTINKVMKSYYDAIQLTQQNVAAQIHTIISTTMQTPHFDDAAACKFLLTSYSNLQTIIIDLYEPRTTMEGKGWNDPWFVDELKYTSPSAQGIWWLQYPDPITHKEKGMTKWVHGRLMMLYRMWFKDSIGKMDASMKLCDGLGIVNQDKAGTEEKLKLALSRFSTYQRKELSKHVQELNKGKFYGEGDPSVLSSMLTMGIWNNEEAPQSALNVLSDSYQLEEMMTNQSKEGILSQSYIQQKCYMKCVTHPHALLLCEGFNDWEFSTKHALKHGGTPADPNYYEKIGPLSRLSEAEKNMRICPEPDKVCQVECWSQEKKGWSMPLHGVNQLGNEPLGVDIQQKMKDIYAYYKENGNASPHDQPQDATKDMEENLRHSSKPGPSPRGPHFWLPVCDSDQGYTHIVDFGQQRHSKYNLKQHSRSLDQRSFPVSCGNFRSDQTVEFMEAMGLTNQHARDVSWTMDPFFQNYAALNLAVLIEAPLDNFLAFCALGIAYPQDDLMDSKHGEMGISRKGSRWCEPIAQETEGMGWHMANLWFCRKSPNARQLFKHQGMSGAIVGLHKIKNHRALCRRWLAQTQAEAMGGLDEIDGSQSKNRKIGAGAIGFPNKVDAYGDRSGKGEKHGHAPATEDGRSKGWFDVMNRKKGNGRRDVGAEDEKKGEEERKFVRQPDVAAKIEDGVVGQDVVVEINLEEARKEEDAYWKEIDSMQNDDDEDL